MDDILKMNEQIASLQSVQQALATITPTTQMAKESVQTAEYLLRVAIHEDSRMMQQMLNTMKSEGLAA